MSVLFIIGTAGSGKSLLTSAFSEWLKISKQDVAIINLDPGVVTLPYSPDIDIRNYVNILALMKEYNLGPNGALIMAADLIASQMTILRNEISELDADLILVDTPGQMELFAFRQSGPYIVNEFGDESKALIYLFDSVFSLNPLNYVANLFLSAAVYNRFLIPQAHVLSKIDLLPEERKNKIVEWSENPETLEMAINEKLKGIQRLLSLDVTLSISKLGLSFPFIPISSKTNEGMIDLNVALERILTRGEQFTY